MYIATILPQPTPPTPQSSVWAEAPATLTRAPSEEKWIAIFFKTEFYKSNLLIVIESGFSYGSAKLNSSPDSSIQKSDQRIISYQVISRCHTRKKKSKRNKNSAEKWLQFFHFMAETKYLLSMKQLSIFTRNLFNLEIVLGSAQYYEIHLSLSKHLEHTIF